MKIQRLSKAYKSRLIEINQFTTDHLSSPAHYIPFTEKEIEAAFDDSGKVVLYGVMEEGTLAAVSGLFTDVSDIAAELVSLQIDAEKAVEIGGCMTLPEYRNKGYMLSLNRELLRIARQEGYRYLVATAHPDNVASSRSLTKAGMNKVKQFYWHGDYLRDLYLLQL
ncbi:MAG: GNAT family N-acetyltransferase [Bacteroides sp.]|nr:GNAT family N-acetyltransferase [Bacteroides sp.]